MLHIKLMLCTRVACVIIKYGLHNGITLEKIYVK